MGIDREGFDQSPLAGLQYDATMPWISGRVTASLIHSRGDRCRPNALMIGVRTVKRATFFANQAKEASPPSLTCWCNERNGRTSGSHGGPVNT
jgi:hypothetical protein